MQPQDAVYFINKNRPVSFTGLFLMVLNDEHQGEGGTLVFVNANNTISQESVQECSIRLLLETLCPGQESNLHLSLRSALFCPLNYRGVGEIISKYIAVLTEIELL